MPFPITVLRDDDQVSEKIEAHAIVRHDPWADDVAMAITVVAVVPTRAEAEAEVSRLASVNDDKGSRYFWTPTRYYPSGRGVG